MKNFLFIFFIFITFLNADSYYNGKCVKNYSLGKSGLSYYINIVYADNQNTLTSGTLETLEPILNTLTINKDKFVSTSFKNGLTTIISCGSIIQNNIFGLSNENFTFLSALTGLLTGILLVFIIFLKV